MSEEKHLIWKKVRTSWKISDSWCASVLTDQWKLACVQGGCAHARVCVNYIYLTLSIGRDSVFSIPVYSMSALVLDQNFYLLLLSCTLSHKYQLPTVCKTIVGSLENLKLCKIWFLISKKLMIQLRRVTFSWKLYSEG